jgi:GNAT superfamily N-acetyltransferase
MYMEIRIEEIRTVEGWAEMSRIRAQVFTMECGLAFRCLPCPGSLGVWHFVARVGEDAVATLSVIETTQCCHLHDRYHLAFGEHERVARYAQLAILKAYRKRGIFEMLMEAAQDRVIRPNGFTVGWLLYPAAHAHSSMLTNRFGFSAAGQVLMTEFGRCHVLVRRETMLTNLNPLEEILPASETCPV